MPGRTKAWFAHLFGLLDFMFVMLMIFSFFFPADQISGKEQVSSVSWSIHSFGSQLELFQMGTKLWY